MKDFVLAASFVLLASPLQAFESKSVVVTSILSTTVTIGGQPIILPRKDTQILVSLYQIAPGVALPVHKHPFPRYGYVLTGTLQITDMETRKSSVYKSGDFIVETIGHWHQGVNIGTAPLRLLVIDQVEKGQSNTILQKQ
jgi:quercetin dioxygenase-like cupin family protein